MALTNVRISKHIPGALREVIATVTFDSSYVTGGEPLTAADLGLDQILYMAPCSVNGRPLEYDYANSKLKAFASAAVEAANALDLSASTVRIYAIGTGSA